MDEMKPTTDTFCILPWMHLATNASGNLRVCCNSTPGKNFISRNDGSIYNILDDDVSEFWNSKVLTDIRQQFLNNEKPDICHRCFREESIGIKSARQGWNERWMFDYEQTTSPSVDVKYVDIRLGNLCNLRCRMCNPYASNQWVDEWHLVESKLADSEKTRLSNMSWPDDERVSEFLLKFAATIDEIYLTGGEPTLAKSQYVLFDKLIKLDLAKNITLKYNTNCTNLPKTMVDYWQHFKLVKIHASIDAYGELNRYIRYPTGWALVEKNLLKFIELSKHDNFDLQVHITVQIYNILKLNVFLDFLASHGINNIYINILNHPAYLNIKVLPAELKAMAIKRLSPYTSIKKILGVINYMQSEDWYDDKWNDFMHYTNVLDTSRKETLESVVDEFIPYMIKGTGTDGKESMHNR